MDISSLLSSHYVRWMKGSSSRFTILDRDQTSRHETKTRKRCSYHYASSSILFAARRSRLRFSLVGSSNSALGRLDGLLGRCGSLVLGILFLGVIVIASFFILFVLFFAFFTVGRVFLDCVGKGLALLLYGRLVGWRLGQRGALDDEVIGATRMKIASRVEAIASSSRLDRCTAVTKRWLVFGQLDRELTCLAIGFSLVALPILLLLIFIFFTFDFSFLLVSSRDVPELNMWSANIPSKTAFLQLQFAIMTVMVVATPTSGLGLCQSPIRPRQLR